MRMRGYGLLAAALALASPLAAGQAAPLRVAAAGVQAREWSRTVERMTAAGQLALRQSREDAVFAGRRHERHVQLHQGVRVWGGELAVQSDLAGPLTVFGNLYEGIAVDVTPRLRAADVEKLVATRGAAPFGSSGGPELLVLPLGDGSYRLVYRVRAAFEQAFDVRQLFLDANTGELVHEYRDVQTQAAGLATGVLGDAKKMSVVPDGAGWQSVDRLRPPRISTYDFKFNVGRFVQFLNTPGGPDVLFRVSDIGADEDNVWNDGALVDAHVYAGYTYDYFFKRHGRSGLDNANIAVHSITHALRRDDWRLYTSDTVGTFFANAAYLGDGIMFYGDGLPPGVRYYGQSYNYMSAALDVVAHELTHGVTDYSSGLIYENESGALNEAFSDIMAAGTEFMFQPSKADYLMGEDVVSPGATRSMQSPMQYQDPDHYSLLYRGSADNGGVHWNSGIANNAFYLAIEGGRHRLGATVEGVGAANREQVERTFYRAFTSFLTPAANFSQARAATVQAARELYGAGSAAERAVTQAWTAVGVQ